MTWRDGVHLTGTPIWCDARRRRDVCFVSAADHAGPSSHGQLIATIETLALLAPGGPSSTQLASPLRRSFMLGRIRLELLPAGTGLGSAMLMADVDGRRLLYAGAIHPAGIGLGGAATSKVCDAVCVDLGGLATERLPSPRRVAAEACAWARDRLAEGTTPILVVDSLLLGLDVAAALGATGLVVAGSRSVRTAALRAMPHAPQVPSVVPVRKAGGAVTVVRASELTSTKKLLAGAVATARLTAAPESAHHGDGIDVWFRWSRHTDRATLGTWLKETEARVIYAVGGSADDLPATLAARVQRLGAPQQIELFASGAPAATSRRPARR